MKAAGFIVVLCAGCGDVVYATSDAAARMDQFSDGPSIAIDSVSTDTIPSGAVRCGGAGAMCGGREQCCLVTGVCFDPTSSPNTCTPVGTSTPGACGSNADCRADEYCVPDRRPTSCVGSGRCQSRTNCGECRGSNCSVCGCDGNTYPNLQTACSAGVVIAALGACGANPGADAGVGRTPRIGCGSSRDCPSSMSCCRITGVCIPADCPECCAVPPGESTTMCRRDSDCNEVWQYCAGDGCSSLGACVSRSSSACPGIVAPVCGCDGQTYLSRCYAEVAGVRVSRDGSCR
jgi:hypothetical protein